MTILEIKHSIADLMRKPTQIEQVLIEMVEKERTMAHYWHDMYISQSESFNKHIKEISK